MMTWACIVCGNEFEAEVPWADCPHCAANYQRPPIEEEFPPADEPNTFLLELIIEDDKVAGFGGTPRAVMWLQGVLDRQKAYLSELADYGRTVERLNGEAESKDLVVEKARRLIVDRLCRTTKGYACYEEEDPACQECKAEEKEQFAVCLALDGKDAEKLLDVIGDDEVKGTWEED